MLGPEMVTMGVAEGSLMLVNQFLDFLLYQFLITAKSSTLNALRPAVQEVLRIKLAREALAGADQELKSYLGGASEEDLVEPVGGTEQVGDFDLTAAWRRARVQCMIYSSLGDTEEDDEAFFMDNGLEGLVGAEQYRRQSSIPGVVSPAVAIWLTSILEFIGEQTLLVAGHAAIARYSSLRIAAITSDVALKGKPNYPAIPMVEQMDTEKVALNPSLGRMWRQWRKKVRGTTGSISLPNHQRLDRHASLASKISDAHSRREEGATLKPSLKSSESLAPSLVTSSDRSVAEEEQDPTTPTDQHKVDDEAFAARLGTSSPGVVEVLEDAIDLDDFPVCISFDSLGGWDINSDCSNPINSAPRV